MAEEPSSPSDLFVATTWTPEPPLPTPGPRRPWGPWASACWTLMAVLVMWTSRGMTVVGFAVGLALANRKVDLSGLIDNGIVGSVGILTSVPVVLSLVAILIAVRGWRVGPYLALHPPTIRAAVLAIAVLILGMSALDGLTILLKRPVDPPLAIEALATAPLWLASLAIVVAIPILEEVLFRGLLYRGIAESRLGPGMAIGLTALAWAATHLHLDLASLTNSTWFADLIQSNLYNIARLYLIGLYLGLVRHLTGSLTLTIILHSLVNTITTAEAVYFAGSPG